MVIASFLARICMPGVFLVCIESPLLSFPLLHRFLCFLYQDADITTGEDALANLSIEKEGEDGPITGFVRIRSRSQGLALSLGSLKGLKAATN